MVDSRSRSRAAPLAAVLVLYGVIGTCSATACSSGVTTPAHSPRASNSWPLAAKHLEVEVKAPSSGNLAEPLLDVLAQQLQRAYGVLSTQPDPLYFLGYQVTDAESFELSASNAALLYDRHDHQRTLDVDLRIGTPNRDQTHRLPGEAVDSTFGGIRPLPLEGEDRALEEALWLATDDEYELARQQWMRVTASEQRREDEKPSHADFTQSKPAISIGPRASVSLDRSQWETRIKALSALARKYPEIMTSTVTLEVNAETRTLANSEGSRIQHGRVHARLAMIASTLSTDGMPLERFDNIDLHQLDSMPSDAELLQRFKRVLDDVVALRNAPLIDPYAGPAILDGRAAGVFFHEIFGHRIEGHRQDDETEGQTFAALIGKQVMASNLSIYDDPRAWRLNGVDLNGYYTYDDEGVPATRASLVESGVLRGFLMSRAPARDFSASNGHGRRQQGYGVVARQANLVVEPATVVSPETLKQALISEVERQGLPFGLRFSEITGGFTQTTRGDTQAFKVMPVLVYRVYPDGREELVRGVDMEGTPLTSLSKILLAANDFQTFNGVCGAESGWVPVSATSPSLLVSQIEVARQEQSELRPPLLDPPTEPPASPVRSVQP